MTHVHKNRSILILLFFFRKVNGQGGRGAKGGKKSFWEEKID